jgi:hypothetical protein
MRQLEAQLRATMETLRLDVEIAVREVQTTFRETAANYRAMEAAAVEVEYISDRWRLLPGTDRSASLLLEDLLDAQERLNIAEFAYLDAQVNYNVAQIGYQKALGTLLQTEHLSALESCHVERPPLAVPQLAPDAAQPSRQEGEAQEPLPSPNSGHDVSSAVPSFRRTQRRTDS